MFNPAKDVKIYPDGILINAGFPDLEVMDFLKKILGNNRFPLTIADGPYGNIVEDNYDRYQSVDVLVAEMVRDVIAIAEFTHPGGALYFWGGAGKPNFRPFFRFQSVVENATPWIIAMPIVWAKKRAYGTQTNYLYTREELAYLCLGDPKKPRLFNVPYLEEKRGYAGYNQQYPAKSEFLRRTNVWTDITEIFRGKLVTAQKPEKLYRIPIETHTVPGEIVFDPYCGSATTGVVCRDTGRKFILIEKDQETFELADKVLRHHKAGMTRLRLEHFRLMT